MISSFEALKAYKEVVLAAVTRDCWALQHDSEEVKADKEFLLAALTSNIGALKYASEALKADKEVVLAVVTNIGRVLKYASEELKADKEVVLAAVTSDGLVLEYASKALKADKEVVLAAVTSDGFAWEYASEALKADKEVVLAAVTSDGLALEYASKVLKADKEVVLAAVTSDGSAFEYASEELKADKEFIEVVVQEKFKKKPRDINPVMKKIKRMEISDIATEYEKQKRNSIVEFCKEDARSFCDDDILVFDPPEVWEAGKRDFAIELYEKAEKANGHQGVPIIQRDIFKILWRVELLRRETDTYVKISEPTILKNPTDAIPSIVSNLKIIGKLSACDWIEDPAWLELGFDTFREDYTVADFDITGADGSIMKLNAVINIGDADANTGLWGGVFIRDMGKKVATIRSVGGWETKVEEVSSNVASFSPFAESDVDLTFHKELRNGILCDPYEDFDDDWNCDHYFRTQFEKIVYMVILRFVFTN